MPTQEAEKEENGAMNQPTPETLLEKELIAMRESGYPIYKGIRTFKDNQSKMSDANSKALSSWLPRWIRNAADNYPLIRNAESLNWLESSAVGLPVVVVGIGPSLDTEMEALKKVAGRNALILATDAALRPLLANRIIPHLVINFDCKAEQYTLFEGLQEHTKGITLLANSCTHPKTLAHWAGPILFFNMAHPGVDFMDVVLPCMFPKFGPMSNHGTVGNAGILLAYAMGADPIITVGMDLCYQKDGDKYVYRCSDYDPVPANPKTGTPERWNKRENKVLYDNDLRVKEAFTVKVKDREFMVDDALNFYRQGAATLIGSMGTTRVVDCSPGGILEACGVQSMSLKNAVEEFCSKPIGNGQSILLHLARLIPKLNIDA